MKQVYRLADAIWPVAIVVLMLSILPTASLLAGDEYKEAMEKTEEEWKAVRKTMQDGKATFDDIQKKFKEYRDAVNSDTPEKGLELARKLFNLGPDKEAAAKEKLGQLRDMFKKMDDNGLTEKLAKASELLDKADGYAGEVQNIWEFSKKFDPANAKDNPTYGLRLIGDILKEGGDKMEKIPLIGQILGPWVKAYGEISGDFANALDRLGKKIKDFRGGALCGQGGYQQSQQAAFTAAQKGNSKYGQEDCLTCFPVGFYPRMRGAAYECNKYLFLYDPDEERGYFAASGSVDKVYQWHGALLEPRALDCHWLAGRANSLNDEIEKRAARYYKLFRGWWSRADRGWSLIEALELLEDAEFYGRLKEVAFTGNYILAPKHRKAIDGIVEEYEKHVLAEGTVKEVVGDKEKPSSGATVRVKVGGNKAETTTGSDGQYQLVIEGKPGDASSVEISKDDYETIKRDGRFPDRVVFAWNFTLVAEATEFVISGTVYDTSTGTSVGAGGAAVSASSSGQSSMGSATTGGGGAYKLTVRAREGTTVAVTATKGDASGANSAVVAGTASSGVDIVLTAGTADTTDAPEWTINVTVLDDNNKPIPGATVSGGAHSGSTGGGGKTVLGPYKVTSDPFSVTVSASVTTEDGGTAGGASKTVTYAGEASSDVTLSVAAEVASSVTVSGRVTDINGVGVKGAAVTGGGQSATTGGSGSFTIGPFFMFADSSITVSAVYTDGNNSYGGSPYTATFDGKSTSISGAVITLQMESELEVTISGRVMDLNGKGLPGATVSSGASSAVSNGSGGYTLPPKTCLLGKPVTVSATLTDADGNAASGTASVSPTGEAATAPAITLDVEQVEFLLVSISGTVMADEGDGVGGASVSARGASTTADGSGSFTLPEIEVQSGQSLTVSASAKREDGTTASGSATCIPTPDYHPAVTITLSMEVEPVPDLDSLIEDLEEDVDSLRDVSGLMAAFRMTISDLEGINADFQSSADYFAQRLRELREDACGNRDVSYSLRSAHSNLDLYNATMGGLSALYGELVAADAAAPGTVEMASVNAAFTKAAGREPGMRGKYAGMLGSYSNYECDVDDAEINTGDIADDEADADDVEGGAESGGGVEVCGDGIDNDGDNEIDECDAGCCDKNVQVTVTDCGNAADDIFLVAVDGGDVGVTPKGAANTFNIELSPGSHTVTVTCLDDGGDPLGSDIGTACVTIVVFGENQGLGGGELSIPYGGSGPVSFYVPEGAGAPKINRSYDGSSLRGLEGN